MKYLENFSMALDGTEVSWADMLDSGSEDECELNPEPEREPEKKSSLEISLGRVETISKRVNGNVERKGRKRHFRNSYEDVRLVCDPNFEGIVDITEKFFAKYSRVAGVGGNILEEATKDFAATGMDPGNSTYNSGTSVEIVLNSKCDKSPSSLVFGDTSSSTSVFHYPRMYTPETLARSEKMKFVVLKSPIEYTHYVSLAFVFDGVWRVFSKTQEADFDKMVLRGNQGNVLVKDIIHNAFKKRSKDSDLYDFVADLDKRFVYHFIVTSNCTVENFGEGYDILFHSSTSKNQKHEVTTRYTLTDRGRSARIEEYVGTFDATHFSHSRSEFVRLSSIIDGCNDLTNYYLVPDDGTGITYHLISSRLAVIRDRTMIDQLKLHPIVENFVSNVLNFVEDVYVNILDEDAEDDTNIVSDEWEDLMSWLKTDVADTFPEYVMPYDQPYTRPYGRVFEIVAQFFIEQGESRRRKRAPFLREPKNLYNLLRGLYPHYAKWRDTFAYKVFGKLEFIRIFGRKYVEIRLLERLYVTCLVSHWMVYTLSSSTFAELVHQIEIYRSKPRKEFCDPSIFDIWPGYINE